MPRRAIIAAAGVLAAMLSGCGDTEFGPVPRVPVEQRHVLSAGSPAGAALSLPGDRGFNIHIKQSTQNPGAAGQAQGSSDATQDGKAVAAAVAAKGGAAQAEFKIGHRIDNHSEAAQFMKAQVSFTMSCSVQAAEAPAAATLAQADLSLAVIDSHKRVVSKSVISHGTSDEACGSAVGPQQRDLVVRLEPGESYDVVLYGRVQAETAEQQDASARLDIQQLRMKLEFAPLTTQPAAADSRS